MQRPSEKQSIRSEGISHPSRAARQPIPLHWDGGSEEELHRLVRAICHTEPDLFALQGAVQISFRANTEDKRGGFRYILRGDPDYNANGYFSGHYISRRVASLCEFAFRLNPCIGTRWSPHWGRPEAGIDLQIEAICFQFTVEAPSAHDKAEGLLTLIEWLDDKLHDPKKRDRAGIPRFPGT